jgi:hypothetical protein
MEWLTEKVWQWRDEGAHWHDVTSAIGSGATCYVGWWLAKRGVEKQRRRHSDSCGGARDFGLLGGSRPWPPSGL